MNTYKGATYMVTILGRDVFLTERQYELWPSVRRLAADYALIEGSAAYLDSGDCRARTWMECKDSCCRGTGRSYLEALAWIERLVHSARESINVHLIHGLPYAKDGQLQDTYFQAWRDQVSSIAQKLFDGDIILTREYGGYVGQVTAYVIRFAWPKPVNIYDLEKRVKALEDNRVYMIREVQKANLLVVSDASVQDTPTIVVTASEKKDINYERAFKDLALYHIPCGSCPAKETCAAIEDGCLESMLQYLDEQYGGILPCE